MEPSKYYNFCENMIKALIRNVIFTMSAVFISYFTFGAGSLYVIIFKGERVTFLGTELPFFDINTNFGYAINMFEQFVLTVGAVTANTTIEIGSCIVNNSIEAIPGIIRLQSEDLEDDLKSNGMSLSAKHRLRNVLMQLQDFNGYNDY